MTTEIAGGPVSAGSPASLQYCVRVMNGLGDAIYHRPFIKRLAARHQVALMTRYPELFVDMNVRIVDERVSGTFIRTTYNSKHLAMQNILKSIGRFFPPTDDPIEFDLPAFSPPSDIKDYAVIRPPMLRDDFHAPSRNPSMEYIHRAVALLHEFGIETVGVSKVAAGKEWFDGDMPNTTVKLFHGQLNTAELMGLVRGAKVVIGGPGWQVPASLAYQVPCIVIYGGAGMLNSPSKLTDPRIPSDKMAYIYPDKFCARCRSLTHDCDKHISNFEKQFATALEAVLERRN